MMSAAGSAYCIGHQCAFTDSICLTCCTGCLASLEDGSSAAFNLCVGVDAHALTASVGLAIQCQLKACTQALNHSKELGDMHGNH